jgi:hypothetical protein
MGFPFEAHPDLTPQRLALLSRIARKVWKKVQRAHRPKEGDAEWGFGCRFNERMRAALRFLADGHPWLRLIERRLHFVFCIGAVPARFYRGEAKRPKKNYMIRRPKEVNEQQTAFPYNDDAKWLYRFAIEAESIDSPPVMILVQHHADTGEVGQQWVIGQKAQRGTAAANDTRPNTGDVTQLRGAVPQGPPKVTRKKKESDAGNT